VWATGLNYRRAAMFQLQKRPYGSVNLSAGADSDFRLTTRSSARVVKGGPNYLLVQDAEDVMDEATRSSRPGLIANWRDLAAQNAFKKTVFLML
jgi:hypothetical protein